MFLHTVAQGSGKPSLKFNTIPFFFSNSTFNDLHKEIRDETHCTNIHKLIQSPLVLNNIETMNPSHPVEQSYGSKTEHEVAVIVMTT